MFCIASMRREFFVLVSPIIFWTMLVTVVARELYVYCYSFHVYWKAGAHNIFNSVVLFLFSYFFFLLFRFLVRSTHAGKTQGKEII